MKVLFVSANRELLPDPVVPLGVLYVMGAMPERHEKKLVDLCFEADPYGALCDAIRAFEPDVVAIGLRNIQNSDYTGISDNLSYYRRLIESVRASCNSTVVLGGGGFSVMPSALLRELRADFGISGEGEEAFVLLLDALENGAAGASTSGRLGVRSLRRGGLGRVPNLHYFVGDEVVSNSAGAGFLDLNAVPVPSRESVALSYYDRAGIENVQTKRGCALRCDYCTYPIIEGRSVRSRDPVAVVDEMIERRDAGVGIEHFFFVDSVFNIPPRHAKDICRELTDRGWSTPWTCYANPIGFDAELAELMASSACAGMEVGSDSGCDEILTKLKKGFSTQRVRELNALCRENELPDCHTFLLGTPGETLDHVKRTLDFIIDLDPFAAVIMAYKDDEEALDPSYGAQRQALRDELLVLLEQHRERFPRWIIPALGTNFDARLFALLRRRGLRGPLWQHIEQVKTRETRSTRSPDRIRRASALG